MPSDKKRVNLTISDELYARIKAYKMRQGISSDASACLQLIVQQLNGLEQTDFMLDMVRKMSVEQMIELSKSGYEDIKSILDEQGP